MKICSAITFDEKLVVLQNVFVGARNFHRQRQQGPGQTDNQSGHQITVTLSLAPVALATWL